MSAYEHKRKFNIGYCDSDFKDELKPSTMLAYFEEVAGASAEELGFGYEKLKGRKQAFMVVEFKCSFLEMPKLKEDIEVITWPTPPTHVVFGREYKIRNSQGDNLVLASSRWCLMDMEKQALLTSKALLDQDYSTYNTAHALEENKRKIQPFAKEEGDLRFSMTVANSEYDHNMHVNNTRYADYCFNCFSIAELSKKILKYFSIAYVKQCHEGEKLSFYRKDNNESSIICGFNEKDEVVVKAEIILE